MLPAKYRVLHRGFARGWGSREQVLPIGFGYESGIQFAALGAGEQTLADEDRQTRLFVLLNFTPLLGTPETVSLIATRTSGVSMT